MKTKTAVLPRVGDVAVMLGYVLFFGSFLGVVIETLWCVAENGTFESRAGLVVGPFNLLYGGGAVLMTLVLYPLRSCRAVWLFSAAALTGSAAEYLCSWWQERTFGSRSWDYSGHIGDLNGRVCLLFAVIWGVLGVVWIRRVFPSVVTWVLRIPRRLRRVTAVGMVLFLAVNGIVTMIAVTCWSRRVAGIADDTPLALWAQAQFPDETMARIFANMRFR